MGLNNRVFQLMAPHCTGGKALAAGYPDMSVTMDVLCSVIGSWAEALPLDRKRGALSRDATAVFKALGYDLEVVDIHAEHGTERIADLNLPVDLGESDLVLDHGTIEHCFNIAQAAANLANAVKVGGLMVQHLPMSLFNHGFYNLNPTWFWSFYPKNGFEILHFEGWNLRTGAAWETPQHEQFGEVPDMSLLTMIARRHSKPDMKYPIQSLYDRKA